MTSDKNVRRKHLPPGRAVLTCTDHISIAINKYIGYKVIYLANLEDYPDEVDNVLWDYISLNANGTCLWVALVCQALEIRTIGRFSKYWGHSHGPNELHSMMQHMFISRYDALVKQVIGLTAVVRRRIHSEELASFHNTLKDIATDISFTTENGAV